MKRTLVIAAMLVLAGCSNFPAIPLLKEDNRSRSSNAGEDNAARVVDAISHPDGTERRQLAMRVAPVPKRKPRPKPVVKIQLKSLVGLTRDQVREMIGARVTVADSPPSTV